MCCSRAARSRLLRRCRHRRRCPGNAKRYRRDRPAIHGAVIDRGKEDHRRGRVPTDPLDHEGKGQQDGHAIHRTKSRHRPDKQAKHDTKDGQPEIHRLQGDQDTVEKSEKNVHDTGLGGKSGYLEEDVVERDEQRLAIAFRQNDPHGDVEEEEADH